MRVRIGELAKMFSCPAVTIRYYEKEGLLPPPQRTGGNYRLYGDSDIERLRFIVHCRRHGITVEEIRTLLSFFDNPSRECGYVHQLVDRHLALVREQMASLKLLQRKLEALQRACSCHKNGNCSIIRTLGSADGCSSCLEVQARQAELSESQNDSGEDAARRERHKNSV